MCAYDSNFMGYGRIVINWKLHNFNKDLLNPNVVNHLPTLYSPEFKVCLVNKFENTKW